MQEKFLSNAPSITIVKERTANGTLVFTDEWNAMREENVNRYLNSRSNFLLRDDPFTVIHSITGQQVPNNEKCLMLVTTNIQIVPGYLLAIFYNLGRAGVGTCLRMLTKIDSPCPGVVMNSHHPRTSNIRNAFILTMQETFTNQLERFKTNATTLTSKHVSDHDISHIAFQLIKDGVFAPSRIPELTTRVANEVELNGGFQSLYALLNALYGVAIINSGPTRVPRKFSEIRDSLNRYFESVPTHEPTILSSNGLPDGFCL